MDSVPKKGWVRELWRAVARRWQAIPAGAIIREFFRLKAWSWVLPVVVALALAVIGIAASLYPDQARQFVQDHLGSNAAGGWAAFLITASIAVVLIALLVAASRVIREQRLVRVEDPELQRLRDLFNDVVAIDVTALVTLGTSRPTDAKRQALIQDVVSVCRAKLPRPARVAFIQCVSAGSSAKACRIKIDGGQAYQLSVLAHSGLTPEDIDDVGRLGDQKGVANKAIRSGVPAYCADNTNPKERSDSGYVDPTNRRPPYRSLMCIPARDGDSIMGVLSLDSTEAHAFTDWDMSLIVEPFARKIAVVNAFLLR